MDNVESIHDAQARVDAAAQEAVAA
jgi:hypothetical protein